MFNYSNLDKVNGQVKSTVPHLKATILDSTRPSKLVVGPSFLPVALAGPYWVMATSPINAQGQYDWALISGGVPNQVGPSQKACVANNAFNTNGNGQGLWIFSRKQVEDQETVSKIRTIAQGFGLDDSFMKPVAQEGCQYAN